MKLKHLETTVIAFGFFIQTSLAQDSLDAPTYVCYQTPAPITVDGILSTEEWDKIPWTSDFVDILGEKGETPFLRTRAKMAYTKEGMYFAAELEEPHVWGTITQHDSTIYLDNNFEIFIDPLGTTHHYLEYEVNALGTVWDLLMTRPYRDGGSAISEFEFKGMKSAVHVNGTLNTPSDIDQSWTCEVFIPWSTIYSSVSEKKAPNKGEQLRINLTRVKWLLGQKNGKYIKVPREGESKIREYYWSWAPMEEMSFHIPERWGYVQISDKIAGESVEQFTTNPNEKIKWILRQLYYLQNNYKKKTGHYTSNISELQPQSFCSDSLIKRLNVYSTPNLYEITLNSDNGKFWHIRQDGFIWQTK